MAKHVRQLRANEIRLRLEEGQAPAGVSAKSYSPKRPPQWFEVTEDYQDLETGKQYKKGDLLTQRQGRNIALQDEGRGWPNLSARQRAYRKIRNPDSDMRKAMKALERGARERGTDIRYRGTVRSEADSKAREAFALYVIHDKRKAKSASQQRAYAAFLTSIGVSTPWANPSDVWDASDEDIQEWWHDYSEAV